MKDQRKQFRAGLDVQSEMRRGNEKRRKRDRTVLRRLKPQSFQMFLSLQQTAQEEIEYTRLLDRLRREELL